MVFTYSCTGGCGVQLRNNVYPERDDERLCPACAEAVRVRAQGTGRPVPPEAEGYEHT